MALPESDARRIINALQDIVATKSELIHDSVAQAQYLVPRWLGAKKEFRGGVLGSAYHRIYGYPVCTRILTAYEMIYEGQIWIAAEDFNRGKGVLLQGLSELAQSVGDLVDALTKADKMCIGLGVIPNREGMIDILKLDLTKIERAQSAVESDDLFQFWSLHIEQEMLKFSLDGVRDLSNIFARARYDVEEACQR